MVHGHLGHRQGGLRRIVRAFRQEDLTNWDQAQKNAELVGRAHFWNCLQGIPEKSVSLVAYSLGARVAYYALSEAKRKPSGLECKGLVLMGGAVRRAKNWKTASKALAGRIVNVYYPDDYVLSGLFKIARLHIGSPCGLKPIEVRKVLNVNGAGKVKHHWDYDGLLPEVATEHLSWGRPAQPRALFGWGS